MKNKIVFRHILTGNGGVFIKEYYPTGKPLTMQIRLENGQVFFAPKHEFEMVRQMTKVPINQKHKSKT